MLFIQEANITPKSAARGVDMSAKPMPSGYDLIVAACAVLRRFEVREGTVKSRLL